MLICSFFSFFIQAFDAQHLLIVVAGIGIGTVIPDQVAIGEWAAAAVANARSGQ